MRINLSTSIFDVQIVAFENRSAIASAEQTSSRGHEWQNLSVFIELGTFQNGLKTISCMSLEKIGVCLSGSPTTTRALWITLPSFTTRSMNSGTLTLT
jgi:hypothetical protein